MKLMERASICEILLVAGVIAVAILLIIGTIKELKIFKPRPPIPIITYGTSAVSSIFLRIDEMTYVEMRGTSNFVGNIVITFKGEPGIPYELVGSKDSLHWHSAGIIYGATNGSNIVNMQIEEGGFIPNFYLLRDTTKKLIE